MIKNQQERRQMLYRILSDEEVWLGLSHSYDDGLKAALDIVNEKPQ